MKMFRVIKHRRPQGKMTFALIGPDGSIWASGGFKYVDQLENFMEDACSISPDDPDEYSLCSYKDNSIQPYETEEGPAIPKGQGRKVHCLVTPHGTIKRWSYEQRKIEILVQQVNLARAFYKLHRKADQVARNWTSPEDEEL